MIVTRTSMISGITHHREIDVTQEQLDDWANGALIQDVMPHLDVDDCEFIMTGITPTEWESVFGTDDGDEYDWLDDDDDEPAF
jgi:hypothetical protein